MAIDIFPLFRTHRFLYSAGRGEREAEGTCFYIRRWSGGRALLGVGFVIRGFGPAFARTLRTDSHSGHLGGCEYTNVLLGDEPAAILAVRHGTQ